MKKAYEPPKVELLDFDNTDIVCTSGPARTDLGGQQAVGYTCDWRYVDQQSIDGTVCGAV